MLLVNFILMGYFWGFQEGGSYIMFELFKFMDFVNFIIVYISLLVMMFFFILNNFFHFSESSDSDFLEFFWLFLPVLLMFVISIPSMFILYCVDGFFDHDISIKILGNQWYWTYEYNLGSKCFMYDSYLSGGAGDYRLLEVDNRLLVPVDTGIQFLISSTDVLHSFAVPSLGLKMDAVAGRINNLVFEIFKCGLYYGQCSEICGLNQSFMPIVMECVDMGSFLSWFNNYDLS